MNACEKDLRLTGDLCNVEQWKTSGSKSDTKTLESRRHPGRDLLHQRIDPPVHADSNLPVVQHLMIEQSCEKHQVKVMWPELEKKSIKLNSVKEKRKRFLRATAVPAGTAEARISYGNSVRLSVCPSVTTRYGFNARWDRDSRSSPYGSLDYLVSYELIWCQWVKRVPSNEGIKEGYPP